MISKIHNHQLVANKCVEIAQSKKAIQVGEDRNRERRIREAKKESNN